MSEERQVDSAKLKQKMRKMLIITGILFALIFLYKGFMSMLMHYFIGKQSKVVSVASMKVQPSIWDSQVYAVGSLRAIRGVNVTTELGGMINSIFFKPGANVKQGDILLQLNTDADVAQLHALEANAELSAITYNRDQKQFAIKAISKEVLDTDLANLKNIRAQVAQQAATVAKKIIQAPFTGRLGISNVNPGQYLTPGDQIVTLQQLDPIYVDFFIPQQSLAALQLGQIVNLKMDTLGGKTFTGKITTINPVVDVNSRNVEIEATVPNSDLTLVPGMFANVTITTGSPQPFLTVPQTAITYNPYGNLVYRVIHPKDDKKHKDDPLTVVETFVTTGETRGDQVTILKGLSAGDEIVTSGQLKLKNHAEVSIDNKLAPANNPDPVLDNNHEG